jgi:hypothetical protein
VPQENPNKHDHPSLTPTCLLIPCSGQNNTGSPWKAKSSEQAADTEAEAAVEDDADLASWLKKGGQVQTNPVAASPVLLRKTQTLKANATTPAPKSSSVPLFAILMLLLAIGGAAVLMLPSGTPVPIAAPAADALVASGQLPLLSLWPTLSYVLYKHAKHSGRLLVGN